MQDAPAIHDDARPYLIGVTGNIACGKSTVTDQLAHFGVAVVDADRVYHDLIEPGKPLWSRLLARYGKSITIPDGRIDRKALGRIAFGEPGALAELEALTHPAIRAEVMQRALDATTPVVAVSAIKLLEGGWKEFCDAIWLVTCTDDVQRQRLMVNRGLSEEEANARLASQPPVDEKRDIADVVIDNSGTLEDTAVQVARAWSALLERITTVSAHAAGWEGAST